MICPLRPQHPCPHPHVCARRCPHVFVPPIGVLHFVGFKSPTFHKDPHYQTATRAFGPPDVIHRTWDVRALNDVGPDDVVVFAQHIDPTAPPNPRSFDDSHDDHVVAAGSPRDR